jgi:hypothetical protein
MPVSRYKWLFLLAVLPVFFGFTDKQDVVDGHEAVMHPFYVSVTEINHNAANATIEISCKMFTDDLENTLRNTYKTKIDLTQPKDQQQLEKLMFDYLQKHLQMKVNGKAAVMSFVGFEIESESAWCYLEIKQLPEVKRLEITNALLYESFNSQISIIHAMVGGVRKSTKLVNPEKQAVFQF